MAIDEPLSRASEEGSNTIETGEYVMPYALPSVKSGNERVAVDADIPAMLDVRAIQRDPPRPFTQTEGSLSAPINQILSRGRTSPRNVMVGVHHWCRATWRKHGGPILIIIAQLLAAAMNLACRFLELKDGLHPMQILCVRMTVTLICISVYMWCRKMPTAPLGAKEFRGLLVSRAISGFVGLYGMWYALMYLPLAEVTVISFLAPNLAGYLCRVFLKEPFTKGEQIASFVAIAGVVLITKPFSLSTAPASGVISSTTKGPITDVEMTRVFNAVASGNDYVPTPAERLSGILASLGGVIGGAIVIVVLRSIGTRVHPLISMNYFSACCTIVTVATLYFAPLLQISQPELRLMFPSSVRQCVLLAVVTLCGFGTQFSLTAGLAKEKSNRATAMIYTHILFAAGADWLFFGHKTGWMELVGCALVVGSAVWVAVSKKDVRSGSNGGMTQLGDLEARGPIEGDEDVPMLAFLEHEHEVEGVGREDTADMGEPESEAQERDIL